MEILYNFEFKNFWKKKKKEHGLTWFNIIIKFIYLFLLYLNILKILYYIFICNVLYYIVLIIFLSDILYLNAIVSHKVVRKYKYHAFLVWSPIVKSNIYHLLT